MDLARIRAAALIAFTAIKKINFGTEADGRIPAGRGADRTDKRADAETGGG